MIDDFAPHGAQQPSHEDASGSQTTGGRWVQQPPTTKPAWFKKTWVVVVAVGLLCLGIGVVGVAAGAASMDVTTTPEYSSIVEDRDAAQSSLAEAEAELSDVRASLETVAGDLPARETKVAEAEAAVVAREEAVAKAEEAVERSETAVAKREKAVGLVETTIEQNTIPGDGIYEVGVDMKPGQYKSSGATGCYYAVNGDANGDDIRSNNITDGPAVANVAAGEFFETQGCADWVWQR